VCGDHNLRGKSHCASGNCTLRVEITLVRVEITLVRVIINWPFFIALPPLPWIRACTKYAIMHSCAGRIDCKTGSYYYFSLSLVH
jgi:hypothetical protein